MPISCMPTKIPSWLNWTTRKSSRRNYPYLRLNAGYGYTFNKYDVNATRQRSNWGFSGGITIGFNIFDGNRRREKRNASLAIRNAQLEREQVEQALRADLSNLWQAYRNNLRLLHLERQNLIAAKENHEIAKERYLLGNLSGIECVRHNKACSMPKNASSLPSMTPKCVKSLSSS